MANVQWKRKELIKMLKYYELIEDCLEGEIQIKLNKTKYLPRPNPTDYSEYNYKRYADYLQRAVFFNATSRTLEGLLGEIFQKEETKVIPESLEAFCDDVTGEGLDLVQFAKSLCQEVIAYGRCGILVDYPYLENGKVTTMQDVEDGLISPSLEMFESKNIINWRTEKIGSKIFLTLVVIREKYISWDDGFEMKELHQYRVLRLENGIYSNSVYRETDGSNSKLHSQIYPLNHKGETFNQIPFVFVGSKQNHPMPDYPPLYDLASLNIAHYRNSADYEEICYMVGQPTPFFSGLSQTWVDEVLKGKIELGSRAAVPLPQGGNAGLLQVSPNTMTFEAMQHKEKLMQSIGAKLIEIKPGSKTATEANIDDETEGSVLSCIADNVSEAIEKSLEFCCEFMGIELSSLEDIEFELNTDFEINKLTPAERAQLVKEWQQGAISFVEMRTQLRSSGVAYEDDEKVKEESDTMLKDALDAQMNNGGSNDNN